jgi:hypothetical protein
MIEAARHGKTPPSQVHYNPEDSFKMTAPASNGVQSSNQVIDARKRNTLLLLTFSILSFAVMGYHPGVEDDGLYLAAVKYRLNPSLYPHNSVFFLIQMQATCFDKWVAWFIRLTGIPVAGAELLWQLIAIAGILFCCLGIARELFKEETAQWAGVAMVAAMFTLPVGGTALFLVDQHLHPRTLATVLILVAVWLILAGKRLPAVPVLLLSLLLHPIMALFGASFCVFLAVAMKEPAYQRLENPGRAGRSLGMASFVPLGWFFEPPTALWQKAMDTRHYLILGQWAWYEWLGAVAPVVLFGLLWRFASRRGETRLARFALTVFLFGVFHETLAIVVWGTPALVRLTPMQPMRFLHLVYLFMALVGGCLIGKYLLKASIWRWAVFLLVFNSGMYAAQRYQFSGSEHLELPGRPSANPWLQAFAWIRLNAPEDAYFALNPDYLAAPGEDYHGFRALAERSQLADAIKDTAVVGLFPALAPEWDRQLSEESDYRQFTLADFERLKTKFGVNWVVISHVPPQGLDCRWHNSTVTVCRVP